MACRRRMIRTRRLKGHICCNKSRGTWWLLKAFIPFPFANKIMISFIRIFESKLDGLHVITEDGGTLCIKCKDIAWIDGGLDFRIVELFEHVGKELIKVIHASGLKYL